MIAFFDKKEKSFFNTIAPVILILVMLGYVFIIHPVTTYTDSAVVPELDINAEVAEGSASNKAFWVGLLILNIVSLYFGRKKIEKIKINPSVYFCFAYLGLALISILWSDVPSISMRRYIQQLILFGSIAVPIILVFDKIKLLWFVSVFFAIVVLINTLTILQGGFTELGFAGIYRQKNEMGQVSALCFYFMIYGFSVSLGFKRQIYALLAIASIALCVLSNSKTAIALMLMVPVISYFFVYVWKKAWGIRQYAAVCIIVVVFFCLIMIFDVTVKGVSLFIYGDDTFTGRTNIWDFAFYYINNSFWFGHGYGSFWGVGDNSESLGEGFISGLIQAHNGYIDVLLELGFVGLMIFFILIIIFFVNIQSSKVIDRSSRFLFLNLLIFFLLNNLMESSIFRSFVTMWVVFLIALCFSGIDKGMSNGRVEKIKF
ncbi:O-antigen ligase family protein [Azonexus hydrophilus]|nr:O-antigen ligase family protein [Azonexus hydrophilus]